LATEFHEHLMLHMFCRAEETMQRKMSMQRRSVDATALHRHLQQTTPKDATNTSDTSVAKATAAGTVMFNLPDVTEASPNGLEGSAAPEGLQPLTLGLPFDLIQQVCHMLVLAAQDVHRQSNRMCMNRRLIS
jgi:hypothetical protein